MNNNDTVVISRTFDASRAQLWDAMTKPDMVKKWWGPKDFDAPDIKIDLKKGGKYLYCMRGKMSPDAGEQIFCSGGSYQEIDNVNKIVATSHFCDQNGNKIPPSSYGFGPDFPEEMTVTTTFENDNGKAKLTITTSGVAKMSDQDKKNMEMGWNQSLDKLTAILQ